jgi:hypothetical protein
VIDEKGHASVQPAPDSMVRAVIDDCCA